MYRWWKRRVELSLVRKMYAAGLVNRRDRDALIDFIYSAGR